MTSQLPAEHCFELSTVGWWIGIGRDVFSTLSWNLPQITEEDLDIHKNAHLPPGFKIACLQNASLRRCNCAITSNPVVREGPWVTCRNKRIIYLMRYYWMWFNWNMCFGWWKYKTFLRNLSVVFHVAHYMKTRLTDAISVLTMNSGYPTWGCVTVHTLIAADMNMIWNTACFRKHFEIPTCLFVFAKPIISNLAVLSHVSTKMSATFVGLFSS